MTELSFKNGNPGAVLFGNFINYYHFHPPETRISLLPKNIWDQTFVMSKTPCSVLDVGCNAGDLTTSIYQFLTGTVGIKDCSILGIDIDPILISRASEKNTLSNICFECMDIMKNGENGQDKIQNYLSTKHSRKFNIVFCFSITMWIHLNHGDQGLKNFLKIMCDLSEFLVIEPQPWKCYRTAVKRLKLSNAEFPVFKELKIRHSVENDIEEIIVKDCGFKKVGQSERTEWGRKVLFFKHVE